MNTPEPKQEKTMVQKAKAFADKHVERFISRKFLAWLTATGLCFGGMVTSDNWVAVTLAYIGTQAWLIWQLSGNTGRGVNMWWQATKTWFKTAFSL